MLNRINSRFWIALTSLFVIALVFCFYFFHYVENKEAELVANGYRIIAQIGNNIIEKRKNYENLAKNIGKNEFPFTDSISISSTKKLSHNDSVRTNKLVCFNKRSQTEYCLYTEDFITPLLRQDFFDDFFIIKDGVGLSFTTFKNEFKVTNLDSLLMKSRGISSGNIRELKISETKYKAFLYRINYSDNEVWILGGLLRLNRYKVEIHQVQALIVLLATLIFLGLVLGMPLLKLFFIDKIERLHARDVVGSAISLLLGLVIVILITLSTLYRNSHTDSDKVGGKLAALDSAINRRFLNEIDESIGVIKLLDESGTNLEVRKNWMINPTKANYTFWLDSKGKVKTYFTPFKDDLEVKDVSDREYFKFVKHNDRIFQRGGHKFYLQSIFSRVDGSHEAIISMRSKTEGEVVAHASSFTSVMSTLL